MMTKTKSRILSVFLGISLLAGMITFAPSVSAEAPAGCYLFTQPSTYSGPNTDCMGKTVRNSSGNGNTTAARDKCYVAAAGAPVGGSFGYTSYQERACSSFDKTVIDTGAPVIIGGKKGADQCGANDPSNKQEAVVVAVNVGCTGKGNPIADMSFAFIRFLSAGAGLLIIASVIWGGLQYTMSRGDPQATAKAVERLRSSVIALLIFLFAGVILNYLIPAGILK